MLRLAGRQILSEFYKNYRRFIFRVSQSKKYRMSLGLLDPLTSLTHSFLVSSATQLLASFFDC